METVLGIDAAWTPTEPAGVALIQKVAGKWRVSCVAPSYQSFVGACNGNAVDWDASRFAGSEPDVASLLDAARKLGATRLDIVALDIPLARHPITDRRPSDNAISRAFGGRGCSAHSPSAVRPGPISDQLRRQLDDHGFELQTAAPFAGSAPRAIEVYPHPALLRLTNRDYRVPYKVGKSGKYWPGESPRQRRQRLIDQFSDIYDRLSADLGNLAFDLPRPDQVKSFSHLKRYEDALDALVCAWVGMQHLLGNTRPYGDEDSAIWVPD